MTGAQRGFLLLTSHLGDPERRCLTAAQLRVLAQRVRSMDRPTEERELTEKDLLRLGYGQEMALRIRSLLEQEDALDYYLSRSGSCLAITRIDEAYPQLLRKRLDPDSPGCLWSKGDRSLLKTPAISLVGSRALKQENREFAQAVGCYAAQRGLALVSGNARGADRTAQEACLKAGGRVISIVADELEKHPEREGILYLSEDGYGEPFSSQRALSRNRCIHALGQMVFVAQSDLKKGGTWQGTAANLRHGWSPVLCFRDGSDAADALEQMGAYLIGTEELKDFEIPAQTQLSIF